MIRKNLTCAFGFMLGFYLIYTSPAPVEAAEIIPAHVDKLHRSKSECANYDKQEHLRNAHLTAKLSATQTLYLLPCFTGAYNFVYRIYVDDTRYPGELQPSLFANYSDLNGWMGTDTLINADFNPKTKILSAFEKGRGLGDCGSIPSYQWSEYGWRMIEYRHWDKCDGTRMPKDWPVIFRLKQARR
jgi:hypothetical protein